MKLKAKGYVKAIIEVEFDEGDEITDELVAEYVMSLAKDGQLYVEYYDSMQHQLGFDQF